MTAAKKDWLNNLIFYFCSLFLFSSTFSIALSQISLALALIVFLALVIPHPSTQRVQEEHIFIIHILVELVEGDLIK